MDDAVAPITQIPCATGHRLQISWGPGNSLLACPLETETSQGSAGHAETPQTISSIRWGVLPASSRRVAYDCLPAFKALQTSMQHGGSPPSLQQLQQYASSISGVIAPQGPLQAEEYGQPQEAATWDFLSLIYVYQPATEGSLAEGMVQWMQKHARVLTTPSTPEGRVAGPSLPEEVEQLHSAESAASEPSYWPVVHRLVALGWLEDAVGLLGLQPVWWHASAADRNENMRALVSILESAVLLLRRMPHFRPPVDVDPSLQTFDDLQAFMDQRSIWQRQVRELRQDQQLWAAAVAADRATAEAMHKLLSILEGSEQSLKAAACTWLELMAAQALHKFPGLKAESELATLVTRSMQEKDNGSIELLLVLDSILQAVGLQDVQGLLQTCSASFSRWFMAHVTPLLGRHPAATVMARALEHFGSDQVEFYILEYADALAASHLTWPLAAEYLAWCPVHGQSSLIRLLESLPLATSPDRIAIKAVQVCERFSLPELSACICRSVGMACLQQGRLAAALQWLGRCGDAQAMEPAGRELAASIAEHAAAAVDSSAAKSGGELEGTLQDLQFLAAAGMADGDVHQGILALVRSYLCLIKARQQGPGSVIRVQEASITLQASVEHDSAAAAVLQLLSNRSLPEVGQLPVLLGAVPMLERQELPPLFGIEDTQQLLTHLQAIIARQAKEGQTERGKVMAVQLALARNLARAQIVGHTVVPAM